MLAPKTKAMLVPKVEAIAWMAPEAPYAVGELVARPMTPLRGGPVGEVADKLSLPAPEPTASAGKPERKRRAPGTSGRSGLADPGELQALEMKLEYMSKCVREWTTAQACDRPVCITTLFRGERETIRVFGNLCRSAERRRIFVKAGLTTHGTKRGLHRMLQVPSHADFTEDHIQEMLNLVKSGKTAFAKKRAGAPRVRGVMQQKVLLPRPGQQEVPSEDADVADPPFEDVMLAARVLSGIRATYA